MCIGLYFQKDFGGQEILYISVHSLLYINADDNNNVHFKSKLSYQTFLDYIHLLNNKGVDLDK